MTDHGGTLLDDRMFAGRSRLDLRFARADAIARAGAFADARSRFEAIVAATPETPARVTAAARLARLSVEEETYDDARAWLERARAWLPAGASASLAAAQVELAEIDLALKIDRPERAAGMASVAAQRVAPLAGTDAEAAAVHVRLLLHAAAAALYSGNVAAAESAHADAETSARAAADLQDVDRAELWSARALFEGHRIEGLARVREANHRALTIAARSGLADAAWIAAHNLAKFAFHARVALDSSEHGRDALAFVQLNEPLGRSAERHRAHTLAFARASSGDIDDALEAFREVRERWAPDDLARATVMLYESRVLARGARFAAAAEHARAAAAIFASGNRPPLYGAALSVRGEALLQLGDRRRAARMVGEAGSVLGRSCTNVTHLATVLRCRYQLTGRRSYLSDAREIEAALHAAAADPRMDAAADAASRLTPRQREIATLLAAGTARREIARRLRISERTAAHHAEAIYARLGIRARWQLPRFEP